MNKDILELIEKNSKLSNEDIAVMLDLSKEEVDKEIKQMEKEGIICGYTTLINWDMVRDDSMVMAMIEVKITPQRGDGFDKVADRIRRFDEVDTVYLMSGGYDLTVMLHGKTLREVASFVSKKLATLDFVESTVTHFLLKKYKENGISFIEKTESERMLITP